MFIRPTEVHVQTAKNDGQKFKIQIPFYAFTLKYSVRIQYLQTLGTEEGQLTIELSSKSPKSLPRVNNGKAFMSFGTNS